VKLEEKILLADDDPIIREAICEILETEALQVCTATNGIEALHTLSIEKAIGVVICDIKMPNMGGMETLIRIRRLYPLIPVVMLTGFVDLDGALEVMRKGAFDYLIKPIDDDNLIETVEKAFAYREKMMEEFAARLREEKMAMVGRMVSGIIHNLNNPLTIIMGYISILKLKYPDENRLNKMSEQINRVNAIIANLLHKTREEQNKNIKPININKLLEEELKFLEADLSFKHDIEKVLDLDPSLPEIEADYSYLSQSFLNIIRNSVDAMHEPNVKRLTITTSYDNGTILVQFNDTGCGIAEKDIPNLFDPYFSTKPIKGEEQKGEPSGTGLGLYTCYQLLQPFGVRFEVESEEGKGTTFSLLFPKTHHA